MTMDPKEREREVTEEKVIRVNGRPRPLSSGSVRDLLVELGYHPEQQGIAVALNGEVVARSRWSEHRLRPGDAIEIVGAVQGG